MPANKNIKVATKLFKDISHGSYAHIAQMKIGRYIHGKLRKVEGFHMKFFQMYHE